MVHKQLEKNLISPGGYVYEIPLHKQLYLKNITN